MAASVRGGLQHHRRSVQTESLHESGWLFLSTAKMVISDVRIHINIIGERRSDSYRRVGILLEMFECSLGDGILFDLPFSSGLAALPGCCVARVAVVRGKFFFRCTKEKEVIKNNSVKIYLQT